MTAAMLVLSFTAAAQEDQTMIVRLAKIEVYPQYLKEYLEFANEVDRLNGNRVSSAYFRCRVLRTPPRFASSKSMPPRKPISST